MPRSQRPRAKPDWPLRMRPNWRTQMIFLAPFIALAIAALALAYVCNF